MPMINIDPHSAYHPYPLFRPLPILMTKVNSFDDEFKKLGIFKFKLNQLRMLHKLFTHYIAGHH